MKKLIAAIIAVVLCLTLVSCTTVEVSIPASALSGFSGLFSGSARTPANQNSAPASEAPASQAPASQAPASETPASETPASQAPASEAPASEAPASQAPASEAPASEAPASEAPASEAPAASGMPTSKEDVINYYVTAYNKIATDSKSVTRTYDYTSNYNNILHINNNSTLESLANTLMQKFMVETTDPLASDPASIPPVGVTTLSISPSQISEATCTDNGSTYEIILKSTGTDDNYEVDAVAGQNSAGVVGPLLRTEDVSGAAGSLLSFEGLHAWYATAWVKATVDKASGHITKFVFETPCVLHFDQVKVTLIKVQNCDIGLLFQQTWEIGY